MLLQVLTSNYFKNNFKINDMLKHKSCILCLFYTDAKKYKHVCEENAHLLFHKLNILCSWKSVLDMWILINVIIQEKHLFKCI